MHRRTSFAAAGLAAASLLATSAVAARDLGYGGELTAGLPGPNAEFQSLTAIHEGGLWFSYVATDEPQIHEEEGAAGNLEALPLLFRYRIALEGAGWTAVAGGGGNPFGDSGGAQLTAEHGDGRYLRINAGHPGVQHLDHAPSVSTFVDGCVWPQVPADDTCNPSRWIHEGVRDAEQVGATELAVGIPAPAVSEYRSEDVIPDGGRHYHYISAATNFALYQDYMRMLHEGGWTITDAVTRGDLSGGRGTGSATDGTRYLIFSVGGNGVLSHFDACVWPAQPSEEVVCPRSGHD
jgi:hypothetical protein